MRELRRCDAVRLSAALERVTESLGVNANLEIRQTRQPA
jgi:hypothetical protein